MYSRTSSIFHFQTSKIGINQQMCSLKWSFRSGGVEKPISFYFNHLLTKLKTLKEASGIHDLNITKNSKPWFENFQFEFSTKTPILFQILELKSAQYYSLIIQAKFWTKINFINGFKRQLFSI